MPALAVLLLGLCAALASAAGLWLYWKLWLLPNRIRALLREQGVDGPPPRFPYGNLVETRRLRADAALTRRAAGGSGVKHDYRAAVFPHYEKWRKEYGRVFSYRMGSVVMLHASDVEMVKDVCLCVSPELGKGTHLKRTHEPLLGHGLLKANGASWARQRRLIAPEFFPDKVKGMVHLMVSSARPLLQQWEAAVQQRGGSAVVKIDDDIRSYSADVISRACFGGSHLKGKQIFTMIRQLQQAVSKPNMLDELFAFSSHIPTRRNREVRRLRREVRSLILDIVRDGGEQTSLLHAILRNAGADNIGAWEADSLVVDNCKSIYFAGYESTAVTAIWCLMLLALHPDWQRRARDEARRVCGGDVLPDAQSLQKLKILTTVIMETLRLYPPGAFVSREPLAADMMIGGVRVPKGVNVYIPVATMHLDDKLWGGDALEFNPARFDEARPVHGYMPFGAGARTCIGQFFAMAELKVLLVLVLSKFSFELSPTYDHSPVLQLIVEPEFGVPLVVRMAETP